MIKLVRKYRADLEEFGPLGFEIYVVNRHQGGGTKGEYATLNEQQSTLAGRRDAIPLLFERTPADPSRCHPLLIGPVFQPIRQGIKR